MRKTYTADELVEGILRGNRMLLGKAITIVESTREKDRSVAREIIQKCQQVARDTFRIGITGVPGVGKSTFIESYGLQLIKKGHKVAVLAIDPSSQISHGSILGDKTRMEVLTQNEDAFIRPSASLGSLGGVSRATRESIILCEAAGYDRVVVETVGVGQSEVAVAQMTDCFLLLLLPNAGDELQGIKRGIMEMADIVAINKAEGANLKNAKLTQRQVKNAMHLYPARHENYTVPVEICAALSDWNIDALDGLVSDFKSYLNKQNRLSQRRQAQNLHWFEATAKEQMWQKLMTNKQSKEQFENYHEAVLRGDISPFDAAREWVTK